MRIACHVIESENPEAGVATLVRAVLGVDTEDLTHDGFGKPHLPDRSQAIGLSWAPGLAVLAVGDDERSLGVDVEPIRAEPTTLDRLALERAMGQERASQWLDASDHPESGYAFTEAWTRLEAVLKADGRGFLAEPREHPEVLERWQTIHIPLEGHLLCIAARTITEVTVVEHEPR